MSTDTEDKIVAAAAKLQTDITPERDLWPDIEAKLAVSAPARRLPYLAQAAAVLLLVAASSVITYFVTQETPDVSPVSTGTGLVFERTTFTEAHELDADYRLAHSRVSDRLATELERLSPESRADVEQNLQVIRDAIAEINAALATEPDNVLLQDLLMRTYREELSVMQRVGGLTQNVMSRNDI